MKIIKLTAENIKKLKAVQITPNGNVVKITGKNGSGKTSVLDSIYWALGGTQNIQEKPIRKGQSKASVEIDLGDMVVKRTFTEGGGTGLVIENKDGLRFKSPQTLLDGLLGRLSFDPLEFMRRDPRQQFEILKSLTGVDTDKLDAQRQKAYDERTIVNRERVRLEVQRDGVTLIDNPPAEIDVGELAGKVTEAAKARDKKRDLEIQANEMALRIQEAASAEQKNLDDIERLTREIEEIKRWAEKARERINDLQEKVSDTQAHADAIVVPDISGLQEELKAADQNNKRARQAREAQERRAEFARAVADKGIAADELTEKIRAIDNEKAALIAAATFPLEGLGFGAGAVEYAGLPLAQASSAEQLRVSMAMAMALNPKLKIIRITDGSLLDSGSFKMIENLAKEKDYQVWIEVVDESGKVGVVIEDGQVAAVNE